MMRKEAGAVSGENHKRPGWRLQLLVFCLLSTLIFFPAILLFSLLTPMHTHISFGELLLLHWNQVILMRLPINHLALLSDDRESLIPGLANEVAVPVVMVIVS